MRFSLLLLLSMSLFARESAFSRRIKYDHPVQENKPIVVLIRSYNNIKFYEKNLQSVLNQDYSNYRIIYIEDVSPDGTYEAVKEYLAEHDKKGLVTLVQNKKRLGAMANAYFGAHMCKNDDIIVILDGDDWLPHEKVLSKVNHMYANPNVWFTYGQYLNVMGKTAKRGHCRLFFHNCYTVRGHPFVTSHLRTYYAGLYKRIRLQDLLHHGQYLHVCEDNAGAFPMLEMAHDHIYFNPEILYVHNLGNPLNDFRRYKNSSGKILKSIRRLSRYSPLSCHPATEEPIGEIDIIIQPSNPEQLNQFLQDLKAHGQEINGIYIRTSQGEKYHSVKKRYPDVHWINSDDLCEAIAKSNATYICLSTDMVRLTKTCPFKRCAELMARTQALTVHLDRRQGVPQNCKNIYIDDEVSGWVYGNDETFWKAQPSQSMVVFCKTGLKHLLHPDKAPNSFRKELKLGLFFNEPIVVTQ